MRFAIPDEAAKLGVKMPDGTTYLPSRRGTIEVENRRHIDEIRRSAARQEYDMISEAYWTAPAQSPSKTCPKCVFEAWSWSKECPRCHTPLTEVEES